MSDADIQHPRFPVGTRVHVLSRDGKNTPRAGTVVRTIFHAKHQCWNYYLSERGRNVSKRYTAEDLIASDERGPALG